MSNRLMKVGVVLALVASLTALVVALRGRADDGYHREIERDIADLDSRIHVFEEERRRRRNADRAEHEQTIRELERRIGR